MSQLLTHSDYPRHQLLFEQVLAGLAPGELAHDRYHIHRVYLWALRLAPEANASPDLCGAAALVHDLVPIPKDHPDRALGGERSARAAGPILNASGYSPSEQDTVIEAVRTSSWSRGLESTGPVGTVLQDADRLDAIGAVGIARCFSCAQEMSTSARPGRFYDPVDPNAETERPLDDRLQATDHFHRKLLRLADAMHLPTARAEGERRQALMRTFLDSMHVEADHQLP